MSGDYQELASEIQDLGEIYCGIPARDMESPTKILAAIENKIIEIKGNLQSLADVAKATVDDLVIGGLEVEPFGYKLKQELIRQGLITGPEKPKSL